MRLTIVCLFAFYAFGAQAQVDIVNTNLTKPDSAVTFSYIICNKTFPLETYGRCYASSAYTGYITVAEILENPSIQLVVNNRLANSQFNIENFEFSATVKDGLLPPLLNKGSHFNSKIIDVINNKLEAGDKVFIENIKVKTPEGVRILAQYIALTIR